MKSAKYLALTATLGFLFSTAAFANAKDQGSMQLTDPVEIGSTHLKPGNYKVEWNGSGKQVEINIMRHGKTVATLPAQLVERPTPSPYNAVVTKPGSDNVARLDEIDFNNRREALVLRSAAMPKTAMAK